MPPHENGLARVIDRIRKLVALARGGGTEAEAEQAMKLVHALLAQHNLTLESALAEGPPELSGDRVLETAEAANQPWERPVRHAAASLYFCAYFYERCLDWSGGTRRAARVRHSLVGKPHNILVARLMTEYFLKTIRRLARDEAREVPQRGRASFAHSFRVGCAGRLAARIRQREQETCRNPTPLDPASRASLLPVLTPLYRSEEEANRALLDAMGIRLTRSTRGRTRITDLLGEDAGKRAAEAIGLDTQLSPGGAADGGKLGRGQMPLPLP